VYPTITAAVNDLNLRGVSGSVRFLLVDATYPTEVFPITIQVTNDSVPTAAKTVTIKPNTGISATVAGASASGRIIQVVNTNYVTIDGSNTNGGTTRDLTIQNTSTTAPSVVLFGSAGTAPLMGCRLMNTVVINGINSSTPVIVSDGTTAGNPGYFANITIQNNFIRNGYHAIYCNATPVASNGANLLVASNAIGSTASDSVRFDGVYIQGADGAIVRGNDIGGFSVVTSEVDRGVWLATGTTNTVVEKNTVHDLGYNGTSGYGGKGIVVSSGLANCNNTVSNNMIYHLTGDGDSYVSFGATYSPNGIFAFGTGQSGVNIYYNSIYMYGHSINNDAQCYSIGIALDDGTAGSVVNNLIVNNLGLLASTGAGAVAIAAEVSNAQFTAINYNDYYCNADTPAVNNIGKIAGTDYPTLSAWAVASGGDANSISANVNFNSPADLHINPTVASPVDSAATPIGSVTDDFDGNARDATRPDIGADEFARIALPPPVVGTVTRSTRVPVAADTVGVTAAITDTLGISSANLLYGINGGTAQSAPMVLISGTPQNGSWHGTLPGTANADGNRVEYRIQANSSSGLTTTTTVTANNSYFAGTSPISLSGVKAIAANGQNLYVNYYTKVTGTVNGPNFQAGNGNLSYYFQDAVGGINLFMFGAPAPVLALGDSITVIGKIAQFRGTTELTPDDATNDITIVANGRTVTPIPLTVAQLNATPEVYESRLIQLTSLQRVRLTPPWPPAGSNANIIMYQNVLADSIIMFLDLDTQIPGSPEPTYPVNVTGVTGQFTTSTTVYNNGYEIIPRYLTDFTSPPPGLSGTYTVGAGGSFPTLDSAFARLNAVGVTGPVTFSLIDSVYHPVGGGGSKGDSPVLKGDVKAEMDPADPLTAQSVEPRIQREENHDGSDLVGEIDIVGPIAGASATNRITVRPATGVRARIVGTGAATFNLSNASYVTFDGIGTSGSTQLSVENTASGGVTFALLGNSDNNVLQNMTIRAPYANGVGVYADTASGAAPDSTWILSNAIRSAYFGTYIRGGNFLVHGTRIMNNVVGGPADSIGAVGIYNQQVAGNVIANNYIQNVKDAAAAGGNIAGIWIATRQTNMRVYDNVINGVKNRTGATGAVFAAGLYHFGTAGDTSRSQIYNNMFYGLDNPSSGAATIRGMYLSTAIQDLAAYNTVYVTGVDVGTSVISGALYVSSASVGLTLKDNIGINTRTATGTGRAIALYVLAAPTGLASNNNDLYVPTQAGSHVAAISTTNYTTLSAWQATGRDSQSVTVMANFVAPDLHIDSTAYTPINNGGTPVAGITTDIDGQTRSATTPDIGADEFNGAPPLTPGWTAQNSGITNQFYSVRAVNQSVIWAAAVGGRVLRSVNGGNTWTSVGGGAIGTFDIYNIDAVSASTAFVTTTPSTTTYIFRTTNGGASWDTVFSQAGGFVDAIHMFDATNGIAIGDPVPATTWTILKTTNGGASWARIATEPAAVGGEAGTQNDLATFGSNNIWFGASAGGRVYRSTNGGATWTSGTMPGATTATRVISVWFNNANYGIAGHYTTSGVYNAARSTDGGATWSAITVGSATTYDIAVGGSGTVDFWMARGTNVFTSTDRGANWTQSYTGTGTFYDVDFYTAGSNTYGWGVKDNGNIVMYYGTITGVGETPLPEVPVAFALDQNYPNPFNPTTTLRYGLPRSSHVTLKIYNMLGQEVATLRDELQDVGFHEVVWNGRNNFGSQVASGVYFYRIEAKPADGSDAFTSIKKMLMLK
jgi:DNA/RNA endonuclease YhcR with UshA esterase domain